MSTTPYVYARFLYGRAVGLGVRTSVWDWRGSGVTRLVLARFFGALYAGPDRVDANRTVGTTHVVITFESSPTMLGVLCRLRRTGRPHVRMRHQAQRHCFPASRRTRLPAMGGPACVAASRPFSGSWRAPVCSGATVRTGGRFIAVCLSGNRPWAHLSHGLRRYAHHPSGVCSCQVVRASHSDLSQAGAFIWYVRVPRVRASAVIVCIIESSAMCGADLGRS